MEDQDKKDFMTDSDNFGFTESVTKSTKEASNDIYGANDFKDILNVSIPSKITASMTTIEDLLDRDKQREKDGFKKKIRFGELVKPGRGGDKNQVVVVPTTTEEKFIHDKFKVSDMGGQGEGQEGDVIGEQPIDQEGG